MKTIYISLLLLLGAATEAAAQKVYVTDNEYRADVKVYVVNYESRADLVVYRTTSESRARDNKGLWYFLEKPYRADKKIYFVENEYRADLKVYFTNKEYRAGWRHPDKSSLLSN
jgi:hypothetical protein